jgi:hypothetical protein
MVEFLPTTAVAYATILAARTIKHDVRIAISVFDFSGYLVAFLSLKGIVGG